MNRNKFARRSGFALLSMLSIVAIGSRASADQVIDSLQLNGTYNPTTINFTYGSSNTPESVSGGGVVGGSLNGVAVPYIYCLQWSIDVVVPGTYGESLVNSSGVIHDPNDLTLKNYNENDGLVNQPGATSPRVTSAAPAQNIAWLMVNLAYDALNSIDPLNSSYSTQNALNSEAGLQAAIWAQVTPGFKLTSTNSALVQAYNDYNTLLQNARNAPGGFPDDVSQVLFISPSTNGDVTNTNQALVGYKGPGINPPVAAPEPATFAMALSGLVALGLVALARGRRRIVAGH